MNISFEQRYTEGEMAVIATMSQAELMRDGLSEMILREVAHEIAMRIVEEKFQEIMAAIDPQAIANLTVANAAAKINDTLKKKIPDKIVEIHKTNREVYQRGLLGGVKRVL